MTPLTLAALAAIPRPGVRGDESLSAGALTPIGDRLVGSALGHTPSLDADNAEFGDRSSALADVALPTGVRHTAVVGMGTFILERRMMVELRYIVLSNDQERVFRLFDTVEKKILRRWRVRLIPERIAGAANRHWALTGEPPPSWPWE